MTGTVAGAITHLGGVIDIDIDPHGCPNWAPAGPICIPCIGIMPWEKPGLVTLFLL